MCTSNNNNGNDKPPTDPLQKVESEPLKKEEEKLETKTEEIEEVTSETSEAENTLEEIAGKKVSQFYVLKFDKPVFPESSFELTDNKYVSEFSKYFMMKSRPSIMKWLLAVYFPGNKS